MMAIDTAAKRFSLLNFGRQPVSPLFITDGTVNTGDKYHLLTLYYGIILDPPFPFDRFSGFILNIGRLGRR
jgi:hypothetical protein